MACARARDGPCKGLPKPGPGEDQVAGTEVPPCGGQAQMKAGTAAQGIGSLGARREGGGSCCMKEFMREQRASPCLAFRQKNVSGSVVYFLLLFYLQASPLPPTPRMDLIDVHGLPWIFIDFHGFPWISIDVHGFSLIFRSPGSVSGGTQPNLNRT